MNDSKAHGRYKASRFADLVPFALFPMRHGRCKSGRSAGGQPADWRRGPGAEPVPPSGDALSGYPAGDVCTSYKDPPGMATEAVEKLPPELIPTMPDPVASARAAGLRYVIDTQPGWRRRRS